MSPDWKFVFLFLILNGCTYAWISPTNIINIKDILNIPHIISGKSGFGRKGNDDTGGDGTTTVFDTNYGSMVPSFEQNILGTNKTGDNGTSRSHGGGNFGSMTGIPNMFANMTALGGNDNGIPFGVIPGIFGNKADSKNDTSDNSNLLTSGFGSISIIPDEILTKDKEKKTREKRHCSGCHDGEEHEHDETKSRKKRQIGSGLGSLGSLVPGLPGGSNLSSLGSALGTGDSGDATLVLGMFQVLVKPIKTPSINGLTDIIKNPQSILTNPQNLLNGGKG